jgi:hypothetical protein
MSVVVIWLLFGVIASVIAMNRGCSGFGWFLLGIVLGPFAIALAFMPKKTEAPSENR